MKIDDVELSDEQVGMLLTHMLRQLHLNVGIGYNRTHGDAEVVVVDDDGEFKLHLGVESEVQKNNR